MSMQLKSIILYNASGNTRTVQFKLGAVNIITGKSNTGKSAIAEIVDYCLGRSTFRIPEGVIRDAVAWYAVLWQVGDTQVLVAKPAPSRSRSSQSQAYYEVGSSLSPPPLQNLRPNTTDGAVIEYLSRLLGISPNLHLPSEYESRVPLEATIRHASFYLYQQQSVIANRDVLFHRQSEQHIPSAIRDTLPYFVGAIPEDNLALIHDLRRARRDLSRARRGLKEAELIVGKTMNRAQALVAEGQEVGLVAPEFRSSVSDEVLAALKRATDWRPETPLQLRDSRLPQLREGLNGLRQRFRKVCEQIAAAEAFAKQAASYSDEAKHHVMRLQSIDLWEGREPASKVCPLCSHKLQQDNPSTSGIRGALDRLQRTLETVDEHKPRLVELIRSLKNERERLRQGISETELALAAIIEEQSAFESIRDSNARIARVVGRISLYLDTVTLADDPSLLASEVGRAKERVRSLEKKLDEREAEEVLASILNRIGSRMTKWAGRLQLEHQEYQHRFSLPRLTVVADRPERPIPMGQMGGGHNWLGCHLIALLALHEHFVVNNRPVPSFLILDQPSQVYFPSRVAYLALQGEPGKLQDTDADVAAVQRMFGFLFETCEKLSPRFQVIVTEHASLDDHKFRRALVDRPWRGGRALIPQEWLR